MTIEKLTASRLATVHPTLAERVRKLLFVMESLGHPMMVTDGLRTTEQQQKLYAQGRDTPGKIVTYADGVNDVSNHQAKADGLGHAVDCCFVLPGGILSWDEKLPWNVYGYLAIYLGLGWGGTWPPPETDKPHVELK